MYCGVSLRCQAAVMVERKEKPFNIFQKVTIRKTRYKNILEKSVLGKLGFLTHWPHETTAAGGGGGVVEGIVLIQYVTLYSFYTWSNP